MMRGPKLKQQRQDVDIQIGRVVDSTPKLTDAHRYNKPQEVDAQAGETMTTAPSVTHPPFMSRRSTCAKPADHSFSYFFLREKSKSFFLFI